jgi:hypothetical protein
MIPDVDGIPSSALRFLFVLVESSQPGEWVTNPGACYACDERARRRAVVRLMRFGLIERRRAKRQRLVKLGNRSNVGAPRVQLRVTDAARVLHAAWRSTC